MEYNSTALDVRTTRFVQDLAKKSQQSLQGQATKAANKAANANKAIR